MFVQQGSVPPRRQGQVSVTWTMMDPEGLNKPCSALLHAVNMLNSVLALSIALLVHQTAQASSDTDKCVKAWTTH